MKNFKRAVDCTGNTMEAGNINYLRTLLRGEALRYFDELSINNTGTKKHTWSSSKRVNSVIFFWLTSFPIKSAQCAVQCVNLGTSLSSSSTTASRNWTTTSLFFPELDLPRKSPQKSSTRSSYMSSQMDGQSKPTYKAGALIWRAKKLCANYSK